MATLDYLTFTPTDVIAQVARNYLDSMVGKTATYAPLELDELGFKPEACYGNSITWNVRAQNPSRAKNFKPRGTGDGQTALEPDNLITLSVDFAYTGLRYVINEAKRRQVAKDARINYIEEQTDNGYSDLMLKMNRNFYYGDPSVNTEDPLGLKHIIHWDGAVAGATRNTSPALVGNRFDASYIDTNTGAVTGCTVTVGSATVTLGTAKTWNEGDIVWVTTGSGNTAITKRYRADNSGSSSTALTITPVLLNEHTSSASASVEIEGHFYANNTGMGAPNVKDLGKFNRVIEFCTDGREGPNWSVGNGEMYEFFLNETLSVEQNLTPVKNELGVKEYYGFRYRGLSNYRDNNVNRGEWYCGNSKYMKFKGTEGMLNPMLLHDTLIPQASETSNFADLYGTLICSRQACPNGLNRLGLIINMTE